MAKENMIGKWQVVYQKNKMTKRLLVLNLRTDKTDTKQLVTLWRIDIIDGLNHWTTRIGQLGIIITSWNVLNTTINKRNNGRPPNYGVMRQLYVITLRELASWVVK